MKMDNDVKGLYKLAEEILTEEGFWFTHCYWNLDGDKHPVAESADCDDPGIGLSCPDKDGNFCINTIVELDDYSSRKVGGILVTNELQLRAVLSALILLVKNWHERLIKLEQAHKEELEEIYKEESAIDLTKMIPYSEEMRDRDKELLIGMVEFDNE